MYSQEGRPIKVVTAAGGGEFLLRRFSGVEGVSVPFEFHVDMLCTNAAVNLNAALHQPVCIHVQRGDGSFRYIHGRFRRLVQFDHGPEGLTTYHGEIVPWFWFLTLFADCRIFQNKSVQEIIEQVFRDRGFSDFAFRLNSSLPKREYCVQYRETDFDFVSRLLEDEGIFYFFEHTADKHTLILADDKSKFAPCPVQDTMHYVAGSTALWEEEDVVFSITREESVHIGKVSLNDYNFEKPEANLRTTLAGRQEGEEYDYPGCYLDRGAGDRYVRIRLEEKEAQYYALRGTSNCRTFQPGFRFKLQSHYRKDTNQEYTLLLVSHEAGDIDYGPSQDAGFQYRNEFMAIPHKVPYRPPRRTAKPRVQGSQTAVVVGVSGEEIFTDSHGRVKVQFHWDREGQSNEKSSCWIRVAQPWAGKGWGWVTIPRIGQEVIVDFLEGDPDRPIITGRVYNADQMPPYSLPGEQTKSTWKSYSSKGGGGFNEIRFEDKKGSEQIFIHAQKDEDVRVKATARETIGKDRHLIVAGDQLEKVSGDKHLQVSGDRNEKVDGTISRQAGMDIQEKAGLNYAMDAGTAIHLKAAVNVVIESGISLTLKVGGNFIILSPAGVAISGTMVLINSGGAAGSGAGSSPGSPKAPAAADTGQPGQATQVKPKPPVKPTKYGPAALALKKAAKKGAPFTKP